MKCYVMFVTDMILCNIVEQYVILSKQKFEELVITSDSELKVQFLSTDPLTVVYAVCLFDLVNILFMFDF